MTFPDWAFECKGLVIVRIDKHRRRETVLSRQEREGCLFFVQEQHHEEPVAREPEWVSASNFEPEAEPCPAPEPAENPFRRAARRSLFDVSPVWALPSD